jgi:hypothetical protein
LNPRAALICSSALYDGVVHHMLSKRAENG